MFVLWETFGGLPQDSGESQDVSGELNYASWWSRLLAGLVDRLIPLVVVVVGGLAEYATRANDCVADNADYSIGPYCATGNSVVGVVLWVGCLFLAVLFVVWNVGYLQGRTGASVGKRAMRIRLIGENSGQPVGFARSLLRLVAHIADALFCYVGYLFPLWDPKKQTLADKIMKTVCVRAVSETR
ncbi:putative RDD family membrane protein YckC [Mycobacterium sp. MAA66]|uniref:RDD family protein n=1 Tax=Mycobacterium sp. MAA66 TaxID=3156297 RepID=UPI003516AA59